MFKGKLGLWGWVVAACLIFSLLFNVIIPAISNALNVPDGTLFVEGTKVDSTLMESINDKSWNGYNFEISTNNPDIYISDSSAEKVNYTLHKDYLYTPFVMYVRRSAAENQSGFICLQPDRDGSALQVDLYDLLIAIENNKYWKDLGFSPKVIKDKIILTIPNERSVYYSYIEDLFYLTLNNSRVPNEVERTNLKPRVDNILASCEKVSDLSQAIKNEYKEPSTNYKVFIGPEFMYPRGGIELSREYNDSFIPVYFKNTVCLYLNVYSRNNYADGEDKVAENVMNKWPEDLSFFKKSGWRNEGSYENLRGISNSYANIVPGLAQ